MYEKLDSCPVCGSEQFVNFLLCRDHTVSQESFVIVECKKCHFKFTNPRPSEANCGRFYKSEAYVSHSDTKKGIINRVYHLVRSYTLRQKLSLINSLASSEKTLLDVGCGTGAFLETCRGDGWQVVGTEPDADARQLATARSGAEIEPALLKAFTNRTFQVITLWHVLEHVHALNESIKKLKKLLAPQGSLVVAVPNCDSYDAQLYRENWAAYDVPRHLYHFTPVTMTELMRRHKLKVTQIIPMKFDAYYVSLLSTQYRDGTTSYVQALKEGYNANDWAEKNGNNYSSLIYVIQS